MKKLQFRAIFIVALFNASYRDTRLETLSPKLICERRGRFISREIE